jgi:hypothetical protein
MSRSRSDWPAMPDFHPEFGLLCPSPRRRRCIRLMVLSVATAMAIGATMGLAIAHRTDGVGSAFMVRPTDERPLASAPTAGAAATRASCKTDVATDLASFFFGPSCEPNKPHARHRARATNRVATVILGRMDAPAPPGAPVAAPAIESSQRSAGNAEKSANLTTAAVERTARPRKPKPKPSAPIALTPAVHPPIWQNGTFAAPAPDAYASAPKFGREAYDPYRATFRSAARRSGFDAPFGVVR